ncbi:MAG: glutamate--tRNA ligase [bacterium]
MKSPVRVRFAPSPTGHLHIGNARTAVLNWLFARKHHGTLVLRVEDTDKERSKPEYEQVLLDHLEWLGVTFHESPAAGGPFAPYRQSERQSIYQTYLAKLKESGKVYPCYKSEEELHHIREAALARGDIVPYNRKDLEPSDDERRRVEREGGQPLWLFNVEHGVIEWHDLVKGGISFEGERVGDFVVMRSNGLPTYNFASAVDDALMQITHVIRGDDHVSNTPKQILLLDALGFPLPQFAHIPMISGPDRTRLSKRHGATSLEEFRRKGYLPQALINFLSLLSWSSESGVEILSIEELIEECDFSRMSQAPAAFDTSKLNWMNGQYIRKLSFDDFRKLGAPFLLQSDVGVSDDEQLTRVLSVLQPGVEYLSQLPQLARTFYQNLMQPTDGEAIAIVSRDSSQKIYWAFLRHLADHDDLDAAAFRVIMKEVQQETGIMGKELWMPIRVALTGKSHGPDLGKIAEILGKEKVVRFVKNRLD